MRLILFQYYKQLNLKKARLLGYFGCVRVKRARMRRSSDYSDHDYSEAKPGNIRQLVYLEMTTLMEPVISVNSFESKQAIRLCSPANFGINLVEMDSVSPGARLG